MNEPCDEEKTLYPFIGSSGLYEAKAEFYKNKYEAIHSLMLDLVATLRAIQNSSNGMMEQSDKMRKIIEEDFKEW
jgi:hypothetical protein